MLLWCVNLRLIPSDPALTQTLRAKGKRQTTNVNTSTSRLRDLWCLENAHEKRAKTKRMDGCVPARVSEAPVSLWLPREHITSHAHSGKLSATYCVCIPPYITFNPHSRFLHVQYSQLLQLHGPRWLYAYESFDVVVLGRPPYLMGLAHRHSTRSARFLLVCIHMPR